MPSFKYVKRYLTGFAMSVGMFSAIPLPRRFWDEACLPLMLPCLPLTGTLIGLLWWGVAELLALSALHNMLVSALLAVFPFLMSGFLHLDGYMDTSDALLSRRPLAEKRRILKDPHTGAFAVIMLAVLLVVQFAAVYAIMDTGKCRVLFLLLPVFSRGGAALGLLFLKTMPQSGAIGYANLFKQNTGISHRLFVLVITLAAVVLSYLAAGAGGLAAAALGGIGGGGATACLYREFQGLSGDLTGFALVVSELFWLLGMAVV